MIHFFSKKTIIPQIILDKVFYKTWFPKIANKRKQSYKVFKTDCIQVFLKVHFSGSTPFDLWKFLCYWVPNTSLWKLSRPLKNDSVVPMPCEKAPKPTIALSKTFHMISENFICYWVPNTSLWKLSENKSNHNQQCMIKLTLNFQRCKK